MEKIIKELNKCILNIIDDESIRENIIFNDELNLIVDLGFDSLQLIQLIIDIEECFGIILPDELFEFDKLSNYYYLKKFILKLIFEKDYNNEWKIKWIVGNSDWESTLL